MIAGDLAFCHSNGIVGKAIRFAQRHDKDGKDAQWNHVAVLDRCIDGTWYVIQAEAHGVTNDKPLSTVGEYEIVPFPAHANRTKFIEFVSSKVGSKYGFLTILSIALNMILPDKVIFRKAGTYICSGLVSVGLNYAGFAPVCASSDLYSVTPARTARYISEG